MIKHYLRVEKVALRGPIGQEMIDRWHHYGGMRRVDHQVGVYQRQSCYCTHASRSGTGLLSRLRSCNCTNELLLSSVTHKATLKHKACCERHRSCLFMVYILLIGLRQSRISNTVLYLLASLPHDWNACLASYLCGIFQTPSAASCFAWVLAPTVSEYFTVYLTIQPIIFNLCR
jgi:hypothetical protein